MAQAVPGFTPASDSDSPGAGSENLFFFFFNRARVIAHDSDHVGNKEMNETALMVPKGPEEQRAKQSVLSGT